METDITPFAYGDQQVRVVTRDGEPWFVARDVCDVLAITNTGNVLAALDEDERSSIHLADGTSGNPNKALVSKAGLYSLILRSRKSEAKAFKRWVTHDALPSIRKRGDLVSPPADLTVLEYADGIELRAAHDDEVIVCLADLAHGLGITDVSRLASRLPDGVRRTHPILDRLGRVQQATFVTEAGMNMVIWRSDKPAAVAYAQWCAERIAELRRHGMTATPDAVEAMLADPDSMIRALTALKEERARREAAEADHRALAAQVEADAPHTRFGRTISGTDGDLLVKQVADLITQGGYPISQVTLFKWLRNHGWLCANQGRLWNSPTKWALEQGYVRSTVLVVSTSRGDQEKTTPRITTAGQENLIDGWLTGRYTEDN